MHMFQREGVHLQVSTPFDSEEQFFGDVYAQ